MFHIAFQSEPHGGVHTRLLHDDNVLIVRVSPVSQISLSDAEAALVLDFCIRDSSHNEKKWAAFEHSLLDIFNSVVRVDMMPGCQCRLNIFILMEGEGTEAAIVNAVWISLIRAGLPLIKSICALSEGKNTVVVNMFDGHEILYGKYERELTEEKLKEVQEFEQAARASLQAEWI